MSYVEFLEKIKVKKVGDDLFIYCIVRKKWLHITPEETVRQAALLYLIDLGYSTSHLSVERSIYVNSLPKRYDIVLSDKNGVPIILVECKAPQVSLNQEVFDQAGVYNLTLKGRYVWITNGHQNYVSLIDHDKKRFEQVDSLPLPNINFK